MKPYKFSALLLPLFLCVCVGSAAVATTVPILGFVKIENKFFFFFKRGVLWYPTTCLNVKDLEDAVKQAEISGYTDLTHSSLVMKKCPKV